MNRYFVRLSFNGTNFHGWQVQHHARTVQKVLNEAFTLLLREEIHLTGCGRTDTGVHAREYFAHFECGQILPEPDRANLVFKLNSYLDEDVSLHYILPVGPRDHARFSALSRTYRYYITSQKDPFRVNRAHYIYGKTDMDLMNRGAEFLQSLTDFTSFSKLGGGSSTNICQVMHARWDPIPSGLVFTITANRFLRNMVRAVVGTLLDLGTSRITLEDLHEIAASRNRSNAGDSVPACGLYLERIEYPIQGLSHINDVDPGIF
jgi:tRNA pseudouridine38-40 synthase